MSMEFKKTTEGAFFKELQNIAQQVFKKELKVKLKGHIDPAWRQSPLMNAKIERGATFREELKDLFGDTGHFLHFEEEHGVIKIEWIPVKTRRWTLKEDEVERLKKSKALNVEGMKKAMEIQGVFASEDLVVSYLKLSRSLIVRGTQQDLEGVEKVIGK